MRARPRASSAGNRRRISKPGWKKPFIGTSRIRRGRSAQCRAATAASAHNGGGPAALAAACAKIGTALLHVSTDYVFDGTKAGPYTEDDPVNPLSVYGASKEAGEQAIRAILPAHLILRSSWVYAPD